LYLPQAQAVGATFDGGIVVGGYFTGLDVTFGRHEFDTYTVASRSMLSRTLFLSTFSPNGTVLWVKEAAACGVGDCDITSIAVDETGLVSL